MDNKTATENEIKFKELINDSEFIEEIVELQTAKEVEEKFAEKNVTVAQKEIEILGKIINTMIERNEDKLSPEELNEITGGAKTDDILSEINPNIHKTDSYTNWV